MRLYARLLSVMRRGDQGKNEMRRILASPTTPQDRFRRKSIITDSLKMKKLESGAINANQDAVLLPSLT